MNGQAYRKLALACLLAVTTLLGGCWSKVEINERTFVTGLYIDRTEDGQVEVTISAPLPNRLVSQVGEGGGSHGKPYAILSKIGKTIPDALESIQIDLSRKLSWGHTRVVTVGQSYARAGIEELLDWINHEPLFHLSCFILVAAGQAKEITQLAPVFEESPSEVLREFSNQKNLISTQIQDMMTSNALDLGATTPFLETHTINMVSENNQPSVWAGQVGGAVFLDGHMVDTIDLAQTSVVSWARGQLDQTYLSFQDEKHTGSVKLYELESKLQVRKETGKPVFHITLKGKAALRNNMPDTFNNLDYAKQIESKLEGIIERNLKSALDKARRHGSDILLLAYRLQWKYPKLWKTYQTSWQDYVKDAIDIRIESDINIQYFGSKSPD